MALGQCRDCGKSLSTDAPSCRHCGADHYPAEKDDSSSFGGLVIGTLVLLVVFWAGWQDRQNNGREINYNNPTTMQYHSNPAQNRNIAPPMQQCSVRWERRLERRFSHREIVGRYFDGFGVRTFYRDIYLNYWQNIPVRNC